MISVNSPASMTSSVLLLLLFTNYSFVFITFALLTVVANRFFIYLNFEVKTCFDLTLVDEDNDNDNDDDDVSGVYSNEQSTAVACSAREDV